MASAASPIPRTNTFFELPHKKRKQRRLDAEATQRELELEQQAAVQQMQHDVSRVRAQQHLGEFLYTSPAWSDLVDRITVVWEAVPTMEELASYGNLDEKEGTRVCRRMFKAVVIWDELGRSLWETLRDAVEQKRRVLGELAPWLVMRGAPDEMDLSTASSWQSSKRTSGESSRSSDSRSSSHSRTSSKSKQYEISATEAPSSTPSSTSSLRRPSDLDGEHTACACCGANHPTRKSTELCRSEESSIVGSPSLRPRTLSSHCVNAVKKLGSRRKS